MTWTISYYDNQLQDDILSLPDSLLARYLRLTDLMRKWGSNLGEPHTKAMKNGLFELRLKGREGIARIFYCTKKNRQIYMLHCYIKKEQKTSLKELKLARKRMMEIMRK